MSEEEEEGARVILEGSALRLSTLLHMTAEELGHLLTTIAALDLMGASFFDLIGAVCQLDHDRGIRACRQFAAESSTTTPESQRPPTSTP